MDKVIQIIDEQAEKSGNHCGLYATEIMRKTELSIVEVRKILNQLFISKKIQVRDGAHGKLILKK